MKTSRHDRPAAPGSPLPAAPWGLLPAELRVLHIRNCAGPPDWLAAALSGERTCRVQVVEAVDLPTGLEQLRSAPFDAVLVGRPSGGVEPHRLVETIRAGSHPRQPVLVLDEDFDSAQATRCLEAGADAYLAIRWTTARELLWHLARAVERCRLIAENQRLRQRDQRQRDREREEALQLLAEQTELIAHCAPLEAGCLAADNDWLRQELGELLRAYVLMGSGQLSDEATRLALHLQRAAIPRPVVLQAYLQAVQSLLVDLGSRSSRHVLNRSQMLLLQILLTTSTDSDHEDLDCRSHLQRATEHPVALRAIG